MSYSLRDLIRASGYAGVAGQSFRNHVAGAGPGAAMSEYKCNAWNFSGEPIPETTYNEGQAFTITVDFVQGTYAEWIKRVGSGLITISPSLSPDGFDVYSTSSRVVGPASGSSASLRVHAPYGGTISYSGTAYWDGYTPPAEPAVSDTLDVRFRAIVTSSGASGTDACSFNFSYAPDIGPFNPTLTHEFPLTMNRRDYSTDETIYFWEWYTEADWTTYGYDGVHYASTASAFLIGSDPQQNITYYLRGRHRTDLPWTNVGAVHWHDDRPAV